MAELSRRRDAGSARRPATQLAEQLVRPIPLPRIAWVTDEAIRPYIMTRSRETKIEIPTTNRPGAS